MIKDLVLAVLPMSVMDAAKAIRTVIVGAIRPSSLKDDANLLALPNNDAANISYDLLKTAAGNGIEIAPLLLGVAKPFTSSLQSLQYAGS